MSPYIIPGLPRGLTVKSQFTFYELIDFLLPVLGLTYKTVFSKDQTRPVVFARHLCMYVMRAEFQTAHKKLADYFSMKDHTSAIHAINSIQNQIDTKDYKTLYTIGEIKAKFSIQLLSPVSSRRKQFKPVKNKSK